MERPVTPTTANELFDAVQAAQLLAPGQVTMVEADAQEARTARDLADRLVRRGLLTHFQADHVLQGFAHELTLGPYRLLDLRGEGGMGTVFKAKDTRLNR